MRTVKNAKPKIIDWCDPEPCDFSGGRRICSKCQRPTVLDLEAMRIYYGQVSVEDVKQE